MLRSTLSADYKALKDLIKKAAEETRKVRSSTCRRLGVQEGWGARRCHRTLLVPWQAETLPNRTHPSRLTSSPLQLDPSLSFSPRTTSLTVQRRAAQRDSAEETFFKQLEAEVGAAAWLLCAGRVAGQPVWAAGWPQHHQTNPWFGVRMSAALQLNCRVSSKLTASAGCSACPLLRTQVHKINRFTQAQTAGLERRLARLQEKADTAETQLEKDALLEVRQALLAAHGRCTAAARRPCPGGGVQRCQPGRCA